MPPKKDAPGGESTDLIAGFSDKECKLLAAAFISSTGPDKYDYDLMSTLTKNTAGSLKKMWPPVKKKAIEAHSSFAAFLGQTGTAAANGDAKTASSKSTASKKRKAADESPDDADNDDKMDNEPTSAGNKSDSKSDGNKSGSKKKTAAEKKAPAAKGKGRPKKQANKGEANKVKSEEDSADDGDGMNEELEDEV